ncbi:9897_t:CDS:2 [Dentiscutata erythropus]|uniref:9897_t:CDS:1 n=1 Tax=Dentiscutata erythropus TaxID=1348616 RepID=A0A9N8WA36_9GLOM|nr:9897_t:CDS:2 [Dentiscutata erythropus]
MNANSNANLVHNNTSNQGGQLNNKLFHNTSSHDNLARKALEQQDESNDRFVYSPESDDRFVYSPEAIDNLVPLKQDQSNVRLVTNIRSKSDSQLIRKTSEASMRAYNDSITPVYVRANSDNCASVRQTNLRTNSDNNHVNPRTNSDNNTVRSGSIKSNNSSVKSPSIKTNSDNNSIIRVRSPSIKTNSDNNLNQNCVDYQLNLSNLQIDKASIYTSSDSRSADESTLHPDEYYSMSETSLMQSNHFGLNAIYVSIYVDNSSLRYIQRLLSSNRDVA